MGVHEIDVTTALTDEGERGYEANGSTVHRVDLKILEKWFVELFVVKYPNAEHVRDETIQVEGHEHE